MWQVNRNSSWMRLFSGAAFASAVFAPQAAAQPNIEVRISNTVQAHQQEFTFEPTDVGTNRPLIVVIRNIGNEPLEFPSTTPIFLGGGFAGQFGLIQPPLESGEVLSPNGSTAFRVDFEPTIPKGRMDATVTIPTNDPDSPLFTLRLAGIVPVPELALLFDGVLVAPDSQVNIPPAAVGTTSEVTLEIENRGDRSLSLSGLVEVLAGVSADSFLVVQPESDELAPGGSMPFQVVFAPTRTGAVTAQVAVRSNDIGNFPNGTLSFRVRSVGQAAIANGNSNGTDDALNGNSNGSGGADEPSDDVSDDPDNVDDGEDDVQEAGDTGNNAAAPIGTMCGFGLPLSMALCLASLAGGRSASRRAGWRI